VVRADRSALALAAQVRAGDVGWRELAETTIARIDEVNPGLNFLVTECFEQALATEPADGPFRGVPMLVKDLTETAGVRTTFSSRAFAEYVPQADAAVVRRMREAGFVILGKSNTPEFGTTCVTESALNGACRNPWDTTRTPGGSSGGAAAAVAAGVLPLAHGSDGGGSLRIPAACCGLFAIKPSRGRVSPAPFVSGSLELSQNGPLSVSVHDAAAFLDVLAGYEPGDAHWAPPGPPFVDEVGKDPGRLRIALTLEPPIPHDVEPAVVDVTRAAAEALAELGHDVVEATPPWVDDLLLSTFAKLWQVGPALYPGDPSLYEPLNQALAAAAHETSSVTYARSVIGLQQLARRIVRFWFERDVDVVLTPGLAKLPVPIGWVFEPDDPWEQFRRGGDFTPFTPIVNVTGQPAVAVPFGVADGLPVGVQLIGRPGDEATLFRLSAQLEAAHPWAQRLPDRVG
jgi:amidase